MIKSAILTIAALILFSFNTLAQYGTNSTTPITDALGRPVANQDITKINGTTEVYNEWLPGQVTLENGETYKNLLLKFDLKENMLTFVYDKSEAPQKFKDNVKVFSLLADNTERVFANGFPKFDGSNSNTYYEVIAGGKTMLLEHHRQYLKQVRDENRALTVGEYTNNKKYFLYKDQKMFKIQLNKESILKLLSDKAAQLTEYAEKQNLKWDEEDSVKKLFDYYNRLQ